MLRRPHAAVCCCDCRGSVCSSVLRSQNTPAEASRGTACRIYCFLLWFICRRDLLSCLAGRCRSHNKRLPLAHNLTAHLAAPINGQVHEPTAVEAELNFQRFMELVRAYRDCYDIEEYAQGWFRGATLSDIRRDNIKELLAYGFYYKCVHVCKSFRFCPRGGFGSISEHSMLHCTTPCSSMLCVQPAVYVALSIE